MASIDKRTDGTYRARWREYPGGPQKTRQFARKSDAQTFLDGVRGDLMDAPAIWVSVLASPSPAGVIQPNEMAIRLTRCRATAPQEP
jgi:hypothetical protein